MRQSHHCGRNIPQQRYADGAWSRHGAPMTNDHRTRTPWKSALIAIVAIALAVALARLGHPGHGMWDGPV